DPDYDAIVKRVRAPEFHTVPIELREVGPGYRASNPEGLARWMELEHASRPTGPREGQKQRNRVIFEQLGACGVPMLFLFGEADIYTPPLLGRLLHAGVPNSQYASIPEAGHAAFWEASD